MLRISTHFNKLETQTRLKIVIKPTTINYRAKKYLSKTVETTYMADDSVCMAS